MWFKNNIDRHEYPKQLQAHSAKKSEIPDDSGKKSGTDWVLPKIIGSGRVSGTRQGLHSAHSHKMVELFQRRNTINLTVVKMVPIFLFNRDI